MASDKQFIDYVSDVLPKDKITVKPMMGEYLLYYEGLLFGGIYDNRFLVKITAETKKFNLKKAIPYDGAKPMYEVDCDIGGEEIAEIVRATVDSLKKEKRGKKQ